MVARPLLEEGFFWRIGNGKSTKIWHDKWLPYPTSYMIQSGVKMLDTKAKEEALIYLVTKSWKM